MGVATPPEFQLMTDNEVSSFLHPTLDELRDSVKAKNSAYVDLMTRSANYKAVVGYLGTIEMPKQAAEGANGPEAGLVTNSTLFC